MPDFMEDVGVIGLGPFTQGPTIRRSWEPFEFYIKFDGGSKAWLTNPTKIFPSGTAGESNRAFLHEALDQHIDDLLSGKRTDVVRK